jgi:putative FmdB family regulatory protein
MPIYEYKCGKCGHKFEELQDMSAAKTSACPKCKGNADRILSAATAISSHGGGCAESGHCGIQENSGGHSCSGGCCGGKGH